MAESSSREFRVPPDEMASRARAHANLIQRTANYQQPNKRERFYDVRIDGNVLIKRTDDFTLLDLIGDSVHPGITKLIEFRMYYSKSYNYQAQRFVSDDSLMRESLESYRRRYDKALKDAKLEFQFDELKSTHSELKAAHKKLKKQCKKMEAELKDYRSRKFHFGNTKLVEVGGMIIEGVIRRNPQVLAAIPGGEALAGLLNSPELPDSPDDSTPETTATFSLIEEGNPLADIDERLSKEQREMIYEIVGVLIERPDMAPTVLELLK